MNNNNNNNNNNENNNEEEIDYDTIYADHIKEMREEHDKKMSIPVQVKAKDQESMTDEKEKKEQQLIHQELSKVYCACKHKQSKHEDNGTGKCKHQATQFFKGKLVTYECECPQFISLSDQATSVPTW
jgi:alpha/beta superfamily hydrolase